MTPVEVRLFRHGSVVRTSFIVWQGAPLAGEVGCTMPGMVGDPAYTPGGMRTAKTGMVGGMVDDR